MSKYKIEVSISSCGSKAITVRASIYEKVKGIPNGSAGFTWDGDPKTRYVDMPNWIESLLGISWEKKVTRAVEKVSLAAKKAIDIMERQEELIKLHEGPWKPPYKPDFIKAR